MTPAARRRARRGEGDRLRGEILAAAEELLLETADSSAVSIRAIAERVGVTPPSIYRHFADKNDLLFHVCADVFARLDDALEKAGAKATDPVDELRCKASAYIEFGLTYPENYRLLFMLHTTLPRPAADSEAMAGTNVFQHLTETVERMLAVAEPGTPRPDPYAMTCALWTAVHGVTSLRISLPEFPWPDVATQVENLCLPWRAMLVPGSLKAPRARARPSARRSPRT